MTTAKKEAYITLKDHKENFANKLPCRLINPAKTEIGRISKNILDRIILAAREKTQVNAWKNTDAVIRWFNSIDGREKSVFMCFDIVEFYPSISESLLLEAISFAQQYAHVSEQDRDIILHARKTLLYIILYYIIILLLSTSHSMLNSCQCPRTGDEGRKPTTAKQKAKTKSKKIK